MRLLWAILVSLAWFLGWSGSAAAQPDGRPAEAQRAEPAGAKPKGRPTVALVLSGGGARGFAHVGVLQVLHELRVPVDIVTGTSMGSIVGGLHAAGYTVEQIASVARDTDWATIFSVRAPRAELTWQQKEDDYKNLSNFEIGLTADGPTLPRGLAGTQRLELLLRALGGPVKEIRNLSELPVPFAAVATDLETGRAVVLRDDVSLSRAMRASMSVPGVFSPVEYEGRILVDGGLVDNLPVDVARSMGADIIIAVNVGTPLLKRDRITDLLSVAEQMTLFMGRDSEERAIASLTSGDVLISPDLGDLSSSSFTRGEPAMAAGADAARRNAQALARLSVSPEEYADHERVRTAIVREDRRVEIAAVRVDGLKTVNPKAIEAQVDVPLNTAVSTADIDRSMQRVYGTGDFEAVQYSIVGPASRRELIVTPYEKSWGYNTLRFGGNLQLDIGDEATFNVLLAHTWRWLNSWGGEWRNELQFGQSGRLETRFIQPLGAGSPWFVMPRLGAYRDDFDFYVNGERLARIRDASIGGDLALGYEIGRFGTIRAGAGRAQVSNEVLIGPTFLPRVKLWVNAAAAELRIDTLDTLNFPRSGTFVDAAYQRYFGIETEFRRPEQYSVTLQQALSFDRYTVLLTGAGVSASLDGAASLGGLFQLSGTPILSITGSRSLLVTGRLYRNISDAFGDITMPINAGISLETGNAVGRDESLRWSNLRRAAAIFVGAESPVGPIYFAVGKTFGGDSAAYLYWGRPQ